MIPFFHADESVPRNMTLSDREKNPKLFYKFMRADFESKQLENARNRVSDLHKHVREVVPLFEQIHAMVKAPRQIVDVRSAEMP